MVEFISQPWPWWVSGPLIGLLVPALLLVGGKQFGVSENLRHSCAAIWPGDVAFFKYDWKKKGIWNLVFVFGVLLGAIISATLLNSGMPIAVSDATIADMAALGISDATGLVPKELFSLASLMTIRGFLILVVGGFLVGFGARYAGGCTSGHAISGISNFQLPSLVAVVGFFAGGLLTTYFILPLLFGGAG